MSSDVITSFLTYYIRSLVERTRVEKSSTKFGFDWIIYNLSLADDLTPHRLPFFRGGPDEISGTKTEPEFGIDCSFLSPDRGTLTIFVLKDEELRNATWTRHDFDTDIRKAAAPDLSRADCCNVRHVRVILAYNKDEDQAGIRLFDNLTNGLGTRVGDNASLSFERWNLTTITERVRDSLLTPSLLPQKFFSHFSYICSQFADFQHGSDEWIRQLVPNWRRFLDDVLSNDSQGRNVRLLPVALIILREHGTLNPSADTGWIDLMEWAMLAGWNAQSISNSEDVRSAVLEMWIYLYLAELDRYYTVHEEEFSVEHGLDARGSGSHVHSVAATVVSLWHVARLGILALSCAEMPGCETQQQHVERAKVLHIIANWLSGLLNANPSTKRPLLDIHHIELFLIWRTLWQIGRTEDIYSWLKDLECRLLVRRAGIAGLPFIEGGNSLDRVFESVATNQKPAAFCDQSSLLLLCILELCFSLEAQKRNELIALFYRQIVLGLEENGKQMRNCEPIDLMGWAPPPDWGERILTQCLSDEGESQVLEAFEAPVGLDGSSIAERIEDFVRQSRAAQRCELPESLPLSVFVLACLKHQSPLPPEFWRISIFGLSDSTHRANEKNSDTTPAESA